MSEEQAAALVAAVYLAMDNGAEGDDIRDVVEQAIDTWLES